MDWSVADIVLIPKSDKPSQDPKKLRPIALTSILGKLFIAILGARLQTCLRANQFWDPQQKGFTSTVRGCTEHSFVLQQTLRDARFRRRYVTVV